jgi:serine protease Do
MRKIIFTILSIIVLILISILVLLKIKSLKNPTAEEIFNNSLYNVVEVKAYSDAETISYGSAVLINDTATFVTNYHVISYKESGNYKMFEHIEIRFSYEEDYRTVRTTKYDINIDLAIISLECTDCIDLKPIEFGDSNEIESGNTVYSIGNGMNHGIGITKGIVSILLVNIIYDDNYRSVIQCDLVISDGNSGGALLDNAGRLIGITTFRMKDSSLNPIYGIAYSIPINSVEEFLN